MPGSPCGPGIYLETQGKRSIDGCNIQDVTRWKTRPA